MLSARPSLVLASASETRARVLRGAAVPFTLDPAHVDEAAVKQRCRDRGDTAEEASMRLAECKALAVAPRHPDAFVLGADQLLVCGSRWLDKPETPDHARATLEVLRGRRHRLISGMAVIRGDVVVWRHVEVAELAMRAYSDAFIDWYLCEAGCDALNIVGACRLEGAGAQAFAAIEGDYFTILGLPLLPLLDFLRREAMLVD